LDYQYDALRLLIYGNLPDYPLFDVTSSQIYFNSCGSNGYTYAWLTGIHANTYRPKKGNGACIGLIFPQGPDPRIHIPVLLSSLLSPPSAVINGTAIPAEKF
jgi:hypothetical protein